MSKLKSLVLLIIVFSLGCSIQKEVTRPNFLFIIVDDLGYSDLSVNGSQYYETPNIDRIATDGVNFTNGYSTCQVCSPSRASIMTSKYTPIHGITDYLGAPSDTLWRAQKRYTKMLPPQFAGHLSHELTTFPEALKKSGYTTFFAGKWHLGSEADNSLPTDHGFDINKGGYHAGGPYSGGYFSPFNNPYLTDEESEIGMSLSKKLAKETCKFIEQHKDTSFLAYLSFYAVHAPIQTTKAKWSKYREKADSMGIADSGFELERILPKRKYQDNPVYAGLIEEVDEAVGMVLQSLSKLGLDKNTVVIFTSDNGGVVSGDNYSTTLPGLRGGKGYQWEGGIKVPFFVKVPWLDIKKQICETPVINMDFFPTILDLAGAKTEDSIDGVSLMPLLKGKGIDDRPLYWHYPHYGNQGGEPSSMMRNGSWKLIHYWEEDKDELYDLSKDKFENENIANLYPEKVNAMRRQLFDWLKTTDARPMIKDSLFAQDSLDIKYNYYKTDLLHQLERERKQMLSKDYMPNEDWWGSEAKSSKQ